MKINHLKLNYNHVSKKLKNPFIKTTFLFSDSTRRYSSYLVSPVSWTGVHQLHVPRSVREALDEVDKDDDVVDDLVDEGDIVEVWVSITTVMDCIIGGSEYLWNTSLKGSLIDVVVEVGDDSEDFEVNDDFVVVFCFSLDLSAIHCNQLRAPSSPDLVVFSTTLKSICGGDLVSIFT